MIPAGVVNYVIMSGCQELTPDGVLEALDEQGMAVEDVTGEPGDEYFCVELGESSFASRPKFLLHGFNILLPLSGNASDVKALLAKGTVTIGDSTVKLLAKPPAGVASVSIDTSKPEKDESAPAPAAPKPAASKAPAPKSTTSTSSTSAAKSTPAASKSTSTSTSTSAPAKAGGPPPPPMPKFTPPPPPPPPPPSGGDTLDDLDDLASEFGLDLSQAQTDWDNIDNLLDDIDDLAGAATPAPPSKTASAKAPAAPRVPAAPKASALDALKDIKGPKLVIPADIGPHVIVQVLGGKLDSVELLEHLEEAGYGVEDVTGEEADEWRCVELGDQADVQKLLKLGSDEVSGVTVKFQKEPPKGVQSATINTAAVKKDGPSTELGSKLNDKLGSVKGPKIVLPAGVKNYVIVSNATTLDPMDVLEAFEDAGTVFADFTTFPVPFLTRQGVEDVTGTKGDEYLVLELGDAGQVKALLGEKTRTVGEVEVNLLAKPPAGVQIVEIDTASE